MHDVSYLASQIKYNCNISDAKYWGFYSPCGLLLRLRDLYRIEKKYKPWHRVKPEEIGEWIGEREKLWAETETLDFRKIEISGRRYRPFDVKGINAAIEDRGLFYGAGFGNRSKPTFFLAELKEKKKAGRYSIYTAGREIARDLSAGTAMLQGDTIIARQETIAHFLWGKLEEMRSMRQEGALSHAFSEYGIPGKDILPPKRLKAIFSGIVRKELSTYIYHEFGEASQGRLIGKWWKDLVMNLPYSRAELFLRGLKDVLSDTCRNGMLEHIIQNKKAGSLGFYIALRGGFRNTVFPDIVKAYDEFLVTRDWELIENARRKGYKKARDYIAILKGIVDKGRVTHRDIEDRLMSGMAC